MPAARVVTADEVRAMPDDGNRYETVHGELLVTPAPAGIHQLILGRLSRMIGNYLHDHRIEALLCSPADISLGADTLVQPDLFVADLDLFKRTLAWSDIRTLYLAVEILSPSTARADRLVKRRLYQEQRIPHYWIVDIEQRQVEVWTPDATMPQVERDQVRWRHPQLQTDCVIDLRGLFDLRAPFTS